MIRVHAMSIRAAVSAVQEANLAVTVQVEHRVLLDCKDLASRVCLVFLALVVQVVFLALPVHLVKAVTVANLAFRAYQVCRECQVHLAAQALLAHLA